MASGSRHGTSSSHRTITSFINGPRGRLYGATRDNPNPSLLLQDPREHVSYDGCMATKTIKNRGGRCNLEVVTKCVTPGSVVRELLEPTGFVDFLAVKTSDHANMNLIKALAERWWDTTNTFHFACGEMTCTPLDLYMISGIRFGTRPLDMYNDWRQALTPEKTHALIGFDPPRDSIHVRRTLLNEKLKWSMDVSNFTSDEVIARLCLLVITGCTFTHNMKDMVDLNILASLVHIDAWGQYDWGGAIMSTMYREMIDLSRGCVYSVGGTIPIWEVWAYEYFPFVAPRLIAQQLQDFPVGRRWAETNWGPNHRYSTLTIRAFFDYLAERQISRPFRERMLHAPGNVNFAEHLSRKRALLRSPYFRLFYLGERVHFQTMGSWCVPSSPPVDMRFGSDIRVSPELFIGKEAYLHQRPDLNYREFCTTFLMREITPRGRSSIASANLREPILPAVSETSAASTSGGPIPEVGHGVGLGHNFDAVNWNLYYVPEQIAYHGGDGIMRIWQLPDVLRPDMREIPDDIEVPGDFARRTYRICRRMEVAITGLLTRLNIVESQGLGDEDAHRRRRRGGRF